jgi:histidine triad (HIT) family protein
MVENCIFCRIVDKIEKAHMIYEDNYSVAFLDIKPRNIGHTLVIPKMHFETIFDIDEDIIAHIYRVVKKLAPIIVKAVGADGVNTIQSNIVSQGIKHFHVHILPRFFNDGMPIVWESGKFANEEELMIIEKKIKSLINK